MSKVVIYILDKFVWILIVAIFTSQALQIAGVVEGPKDFSLRELHFYSQENNDYAPIHQEELHGVRGKRQAGDRSPLIDNLFNEDENESAFRTRIKAMHDAHRYVITAKI
ncbi:uncharacterized protein [Atheta coriaria]|uniref:uncharacterized protein isoform X2 n=1 Tax=Dalotia coriaria TaxID=877792 RepID=UPI0031F3C087